MSKVYIELDKDNIVVGWSHERYSDNAIEIDYQEDFYGKLGFVKFTDGILSIDESKKEEQSKDAPTVDDVVKTVGTLSEQITQGQDDIIEIREAVAEMFEMINSGGDE